MFGQATSFLTGSTARENVTRDHDRVITALEKITSLPKLDNLYVVVCLLEFRDSLGPTSQLSPVDSTVLEIIEELLVAEEKAISVSPLDPQ